MDRCKVQYFFRFIFMPQNNSMHLKSTEKVLYTLKFRWKGYEKFLYWN